MIEQLKTIRAGLETATCYSMLGVDAHSVQIALTALTQLEQAVGSVEPVAWIEHHQGSIAYNPYPSAARQLPDGVRFDLYTAAPPAQQPQYEAGDMASAAAQGFRDGVASAAQQPLERAQTLADAFKNCDANHAGDLGYRSKQPQAEAVPPDVVRDAVVAEREACAALAQGYAGQVGDVAWAVAAAIRGRGNAAIAQQKGQP